MASDELVQCCGFQSNDPEIRTAHQQLSTTVADIAMQVNRNKLHVCMYNMNTNIKLSRDTML